MRAYEITPRHTQLVINESLLNEDSFWGIISKLISKGGQEAKAVINAGEKILDGAKDADKAADAAGGFAKVGKGIGDAGAGVLKGSIGGAVGWTTLQINDAINSIKAAMPKVWEYVENGTIPLALVIGALVLYGGVKLIDKYTAPDAQHNPAPSA